MLDDILFLGYFRAGGLLQDASPRRGGRGKPVTGGAQYEEDRQALQVPWPSAGNKDD